MALAEVVRAARSSGPDRRSEQLVELADLPDRALLGRRHKLRKLDRREDRLDVHLRRVPVVPEGREHAAPDVSQVLFDRGRAETALSLALAQEHLDWQRVVSRIFAE